MSDTVDRRVVEMRFDNQDFEKNVQSTMSALDKLKQRLNFSKTEQSFGTSANGLATAVDSVKNRFSALEVIGVTALANITNSAVNLGKRLTKSLTIDQVKAGFSEYELKMGSIQTIMASTGADLDYVNKKLNELNTYSDRTIYSFSDMTNSIGKFTNAGVSLDDAVAAIQGISNEAAVSGANAQEASRAMYNFAQALSAGYVKLIDWKSIENANMATVEFKQQLIDSAVAAGTLEKQMDGTYKVLTKGGNGGFKESISATKNFNDSLSAAWMTTEVLTGTLAKYADETTDIGKKAFAAAQDVKTFSQLMDTIKESIGSGWAQTFEIIFGNLEEAKKLWTAVNNVVSGFVSASSDARNTILQTWKDLGGREDIANGLKSAFGMLHDAYKEAFPAPTTKQLEKVGKRLKEFTEGFAKSMENFTVFKPYFVDIFKAAADVVGLAKDAFAGLFKVLGGGDSGKSPVGLLLSQLIQVVAFLSRGVSAVIKFVRATGALKAIGKVFSTLNNILFKAVVKIHEYLWQISGLTSKLGKPLKQAADTVRKLFDAVDISKLNLLEKITNAIGKAVKSVSKSVANLVSWITSLNLAGVGGLLAGGGIFTAALKFSKLLDSFLKKGEDVKESGGGIVDVIKDTFGALTSSLEALSSAIKATVLTSIATSILELAFAMKILESIDSDKLGDVLITVAAMFTELGVATKALLGVTAGGSLKQLFILSSVLSSLSKSLVLMALAAKILSTMDWNGLAKGLVGIGGILFELKLFMGSMAKTGGASVKGVVGLAAGIYIMAKALGVLAEIDKEGMERGLGAMAAVLGMLGIFTNVVNPKGIVKTGIAMIFISAAMGHFAKVVNTFGKIKPERIKKGLLGMAGALGAVALAMRLMPKGGNLGKGLGLIIVAKALDMLAGVLKKVGKIPMEKIKNGLKGIAVVLAEVVIAMKLAKGSIGGAAAILVAAEAIKVLAVSLKMLAEMDPKKLGIALIALAGALTAIMIAGALANTIAVGLLALGGAVLMIGVGAMAAGAGVLMLASGLSLLVGMADVTLPVIVAFLTSLIELIPIFMREMGYGFIALLDVLTDSYEAFVKFGTTILTATIDGFIATLPKFVELIGVLIDTFSTVILEHLPKIIDTGIKVIFAFLDGVTKALPQLVDKAFQLIITFIDSMATAIDNNGDRLREAFVHLIKSIIEFIAKSAVQFFNKGKEIVGKLKEGFIQKKNEVVKSIHDIIDKVKETIVNFKDRFFEAGKNLIRGLINGIKNVPILGTIADLGGSIISKFKSVLGIASPSKVFYQFGLYISEGLAKGLLKGNIMTEKALKKLISVFNIDGLYVGFFNASKKEVQKQVTSLVNHGAKIFTGANKAINQYLDDYTKATKNKNGSFAKNTTYYKNAKIAVENFTKSLYKNSYAYKESLKNVRLYNKAISKEQSNYKELKKKLGELEKAYGKAKGERKKKLAQEIKDVKQQMKESRKNIKDLTNGLKEELKAISDGPKEAYKEYRRSIRDAVKDSADILKVGVENHVNLFERMEEVEAMSVDELLYNMQSQIKGISDWREDLEKLGKKGIAKGLLDKLEAMGPEGAKYIKAFLNMSKEELKKANVMFEAEGELTSQTLIDNMQKQLDAVNAWSDNITKISKMGIKYDFLKELVDAGPDNAEYVQAIANMTEAQIAEINKLYTKEGQLPSSVADNVLAALANALNREDSGKLADSSAKSASAVAQAIAYELKDVADNAEEAGAAVATALSVGIKAGQPGILEASKIVGDGALNEFKTYFSTENGTSLGVEITNGLVTGLQTGQLTASEAARELARQAYLAMTDELDIHSPSRKTAEIGRYSVLGLADGLTKYSNLATVAAAQLGGDTYSAIRDSLGKVYSYIDDNIEQPVIKPTLDLSDIDKKAKTVNDLFESGRVKVGITDPGKQIQNGAQFNFTQNNYSPKALSRIEIYRQTRNQFSAWKGVVDRT